VIKLNRITFSVNTLPHIVFAQLTDIAWYPLVIFVYYFHNIILGYVSLLIQHWDFLYHFTWVYLEYHLFSPKLRMFSIVFGFMSWNNPWTNLRPSRVWSWGSCRSPVGPPGFTAAMGPWPHGVVPGLQCQVDDVHGSLQGGPLSPCPHSSSGPLPGTQSWSDGFSSLPTQLRVDSSLQPWCGQGFLLESCVFRRWNPDVFLGELSSASSCPPGAPPQDSVWHSLFTKCGSCDCSGRVSADLFSSFPRPWFLFSFFLSFSFLPSFLSAVWCVHSCVCVCVPGCVCIHHWVLETTGNYSLLVDFLHVMTGLH